MTPRISVLTPAFRCARFLPQCIQSVLDQGVADVEHIVMDGGSQDGTVEILQAHPHLRWRSEPDGGEAEALNKALALATGDILLWLNADDWVEPGAFHAVLEACAADPAPRVLYGGCRFVDGEGAFLGLHRPLPHLDFGLILRWWLLGVHPRQPSIYFPRELARKAGTFQEDLHYSIDFDYHLRLAALAPWQALDRTLSSARLWEGSKSDAGGAEAGEARMVRSHWRIVLAHLPRLAPAAQALYWQDYFLRQSGLGREPEAWTLREPYASQGRALAELRMGRPQGLANQGQETTLREALASAAPAAPTGPLPSPEAPFAWIHTGSAEALREAAPTLATLAADLPRNPLVVLCPADAQQVLAQNPHLDRVVAFDPDDSPGACARAAALKPAKAQLASPPDSLGLALLQACGHGPSTHPPLPIAAMEARLVARLKEDPSPRLLHLRQGPSPWSEALAGLMRHTRGWPCLHLVTALPEAGDPLELLRVHGVLWKDQPPALLLEQALAQCSGKLAFAVIDGAPSALPEHLRALRRGLREPALVLVPGGERHRPFLPSPEEAAVLGEAPEGEGAWLFEVQPLPQPTPALRHALVLLPWEVADQVLATALFAPLKAAHPGLRLTVACGDSARELLTLCPEVDGMVALDPARARRDDAYRLEVGRALHGLQADLALCSGPRDLLSDALLLLSGAPARVGPLGDGARFRPPDKALADGFYTTLVETEDPWRSDLDRLGDLLAAAGIPAEGLRPALRVPAAAKDRARALLAAQGLDPARTLAVAAEGAQPGLEYEAFEEALAPLRAEGWSILPVGFEAPTAQSPQPTAPSDLATTAALLELLPLLVTGEGPLVHLACALGRPQAVALSGAHFGRLLPYSPLTAAAVLPLDCYFCSGRCAYAEPHCLRGLAPKVLEAAIRWQLEGAGSVPRLVAQQGWHPSEGGPAWMDLAPGLDSSAVEVREVGPGSGARSPKPSRIPMVWEGDFFTHRSLARVNRELARALLATGAVDLALQTPADDHFDPAADPAWRALAACRHRVHASPALHLRHGWPPSFDAPPSGRWIAIQPWEFGHLPEAWVPLFRDRVEELWVPSNWLRDCVVESGVPEGKVFVVPNGVDVELFRPEGPRLDLPTRKSFTFLFMGGTNRRKGLDLLLRAYGSAFRANDDVCLLVKGEARESGIYREAPELERILAEFRRDPTAPEVAVLTRNLEDGDVASLTRACDALVHPYRGEGFALPVAEAMACGLPVIVTGGGACLDYCDDGTAFLIPSRKVDVPPSDVPGLSPAGRFWYEEPDPEALAVLLRRLADHPEETRAKALAGEARIRERFTWGHAAQVALARIRVLAEDGQGVRAGG